MKKQKSTTTQTPAVPQVPVAQGHYDQNRMIALWGQGKSVTDIAQDQGCSPVYARRVLSTKAPDVYKAGLELRHTATQAGLAVQPAAKVSQGNGKGIAEAISVIARAVAQATFSDAQLVPQPTTREEMFANISKGVRAGVKKLGIGFHS
ncbi:MAG: hypothetical protein ACRDRL_29475 [Sciscionella sp.]